MPHHPHPHHDGHLRYRGTDATVTDAWLDFAGRRLAIAELQDLRVDTAQPSQRPLAIALGSLAFPLVSAFSGVRGTQWLAVALITVCGLAVAALLRRRHAPPRLLLATYRGRPTVAYWHTDERIFNQVAFAVLRAAERHQRPRATGGDRPLPAVPPEKTRTQRAVSGLAEPQLGE